MFFCCGRTIAKEMLRVWKFLFTGTHSKIDSSASKSISLPYSSPLLTTPLPTTPLPRTLQLWLHRRSVLCIACFSYFPSNDIISWRYAFDGRAYHRQKCASDTGSFFIIPFTTVAAHYHPFTSFVAKIRSHIAGSTPLPTTVRACLSYREEV